MPETPLDSYLPTVRPDAHDKVRALAAAIEAAREAVAKHPNKPQRRPVTAR